jgi:hypothetical protein
MYYIICLMNTLYYIYLNVFSFKMIKKYLFWIYLLFSNKYVVFNKQSYS